MRDDRILSYIEESALSTAIRGAIARLDDRETHWNATSWGRELVRLRNLGRELIENGMVMQSARAMQINDPLADTLAALAMQPGGVRICEVVFCARHYPHGTTGIRRYACPLCDAGATQDLFESRERRDVITYEGKPL